MLPDGRTWITAYLQQTAGHAGTLGNLNADALATLGTNLLQPEFTFTFLYTTPTQKKYPYHSKQGHVVA
jgi:hypothetical protein